MADDKNNNMADENNNSTVAFKKQCIKRSFQSSWLDNSEFKDWLVPLSENKAFCSYCKIELTCRKSIFVRHLQSQAHVSNANRFQNNNLMRDLSDNDKLCHTDKVKRAEIKLAAFFAEHNVAFSIADHLIPLLKDVCIEPQVVQDLTLARTKCTQIVKNIISKRETEKVIENLQKCKFSILVDESTDIGDVKYLCVLVRYLHPKTGEIMTQLLDLICLDAKNCSSNMIFQAFKNCILKYNIPLKNIVGMASDNASVMIGCNNSFMSHLKEEVPQLVTMNCICHSSALVASKACEKLPENCEKLIRSVATYVSGSAKRSAILIEFQEFFNVESNKILKLCNTRWLVLHNCVVRLLDNWEVLRHYFLLATTEDSLQSAHVILNLLNDDYIKAYLLFLKYVLNFFNRFNALLQSRKILIHKLFELSQQIIRQIAQNFIIPTALTDISLLNVESSENFKTLNEIYVGPECEQFISNKSTEHVQEIKSKCLDFYVTAVREMLKRLPCKDAFFEHLTFLDAKVALFYEGRSKIRDLTIIATRVGNFDLTKLALEWGMLPSVFTEVEKSDLARLEINDMWKKILQFEDFDGEKAFPTLHELIEIVFSLPHSNAEAERIFSIVTGVKNKSRNSLNSDSLSAICITRSAFQSQNINCINFQVDSRHLELHNSENLYESRNVTENP